MSRHLQYQGSRVTDFVVAGDGSGGKNFLHLGEQNLLEGYEDKKEGGDVSTQGGLSALKIIKILASSG